MRFHFFHLMSYPHLPPDFTSNYRSVWVDPPNRLFDPEAGHAMYNEYLDELEYAAKAGFETFVITDACRALDAAGSLEAAHRSFANFGVRLIKTGELSAAA